MLVVLAMACAGVYSVVLSPALSEAGSLEIPACTFDRGNARIYAKPEQYAVDKPLAGGGPQTPEESVEIVTWIDANVPYYGTYRGKRNISDKDHPDYRALPLAGK